MPTPPEQWVITASFRSGDKAFWGSRRYGGPGLTPYRGNAHRYESRNAALYMGYSLKEAHLLREFEVEQMERPRHNVQVD